MNLDSPCQRVAAAWPILRSFVLALALAVVSVVAGSERGLAAEESGPVVFAAASLKNALDEATDEWQKATGKHATTSYAASSALARQIQNGAPADLYISADLDWMDDLQQRDLVSEGTRTDLLGNALVLVAPKQSTISLRIAADFDLAAALGSGRLALADPTAVPAGKYARAALESLRVWATVSDRLAPAENVRAALLLVSRGEAPLAIVYASDAVDEPKVRVVDTFPAGSHPPIIYPMALMKKSTNPDAQALRLWLAGPAARAIFQRHGFTQP